MFAPDIRSEGSEAMFTGIIEEVGRVLQIQKGAKSGKLTFGAKKVLSDVHLGDSIAVNGVCLTVVEFTSTSFTVDVMSETLSRSALGGLQKGSAVNMERAMASDGRFGGHIVSGHIDGVGQVANKKKDDNAVWVTIETPPSLLHYIVEKGSIAIDGISLTVAYVDQKCFQVSLIPHTGKETTLLDKTVGEKVNLECDVIGKYIEKLMQPKTEASNPKSGLDMGFLMKHGF